MTARAPGRGDGRGVRGSPPAEIRSWPPPAAAAAATGIQPTASSSVRETQDLGPVRFAGWTRARSGASRPPGHTSRVPPMTIASSPLVITGDPPAPVLDTALDNGRSVPSTDIRLTEPRLSDAPPGRGGRAGPTITTSSPSTPRRRPGLRQPPARPRHRRPGRAREARNRARNRSRANDRTPILAAAARANRRLGRLARSR